MEKHLVSIIIPVYNRAHLIGETLDSVLKQTYSNWECIIVDDHSNDKTIEVVKGYVEKDDRFKIYLRPESRIKGASACRNFGFEKSKGEYINWFDSDDIMLPDFLSNKINLFKCNPSLDAAFAYGAYFEKDKSIIEIRKPKLDGDNYLVDYVLSKLFFITHGPLWKRSFLELKQLYDEYRSKLQDTEFHFRMLLHNLNFDFYRSSYLFLIRRGSERISSKKYLTLNKLEDVLEYHYYTSQNYNFLPLEFKCQYKLITTRKTLQAFYELVSLQNKLSVRFRMALKHRSKLKNSILELRKGYWGRVKLCLVILSIVVFKKGFSLLK